MGSGLERLHDEVKRRLPSVGAIADRANALRLVTDVVIAISACSASCSYGHRLRRERAVAKSAFGVSVTKTLLFGRGLRYTRRRAKTVGRVGDRNDDGLCSTPRNPGVPLE